MGLWDSWACTHMHHQDRALYEHLVNGLCRREIHTIHGRRVGYGRSQATTSYKLHRPAASDNPAAVAIYHRQSRNRSHGISFVSSCPETRVSNEMSFITAVNV